ncbi:hypothetical protein FTX61_09155 [Nitriliruptoraceae bacterium ZYF776]|nr:hypothetical protein [Profundirhabdus halotolerans]
MSGAAGRRACAPITGFRGSAGRSTGRSASGHPDDPRPRPLATVTSGRGALPRKRPDQCDTPVCDGTYELRPSR